MSKNEDIIVKIQTLPKGHKDSIGYISKAIEKIKKNSNHGFSKLEVDRLTKIENQLQSAFKPLNNNLIKILESTEAFKKFKESLKDFFDTLKELTKKGWFVSDYILSEYRLDEIQYLLSLEDDKIGEFLIIKHGTINEINNKLRKIGILFPKRKPILNEIGKAYELKMYSSVIALCYSQADGICSETWSHGFFDKDKDEDYKLKLFMKLEDLNLGVSSHLINHDGLTYNELIMNSKNNVLKPKEIRIKSYNRHLVIHGHSVNYGTKVNAFRAILLIDFLVFCVNKWQLEEIT